MCFGYFRKFGLNFKSCEFGFRRFRRSNATFGVRMRRSAFKRDARRSKCDVWRSKRENFERPFTPRGWLRSGSNLAKTRFRRFPTFHILTSKNFFWQNFLDVSAFDEIFLNDFLRFGRIHALWASLAYSPWKMTPTCQKFKSLRSLAKGFKDDWSFFPLILDQNWFTVFCSTDHMMVWWFDDVMIWGYDDIMIWWYDNKAPEVAFWRKRN